MLAKVQSAGVLGVDAFGVCAEVDVSGGLPGYHLVGLGAGAVKEGGVRVRAALEHSGWKPVPPLRSSPRPAAASLAEAPDDGPDDAGRARRLEWARLLRRAFAVDVLTCARCRGPMRLVAFIEDERIARRILEHLGLPPRAPPRGRPRRGQQLLPLDLVSADADGIDPPLVLD